jgi:transposase
MPAPLSEDLRIRVIALLEDGHSAPEVARRLLIADASVRNIYKRFKEDGTWEAKKMGGSRIPKIIQKAGEEFIEQQIKARPDIICKELQTMYINHFNQLVSEDTIRRCVKKLGYVKKKHVFVHRNSRNRK